MKDRRYVILRRDRDTGEICGYCENSFSMSFNPDRVKVYGCCMKTGEEQSEKNYQYYLENQKKKNMYKGMRGAKSPNQKLWYELRAAVNSMNSEKGGGAYEYKLLRLGDRCPVEVDFTEYDMMKSRKMKYDKYLWRNQPIKAVHPEKW